MVVVSVIWNLALWSTGRRVTMNDVRQVFVPGIFFGLNLTVFFAGATHNSVANAALIESLAPFLIVPVGAWLFAEAGGTVAEPAREAFVEAMSRGSLLVALVAAAGALIAWRHLPARSQPRPLIGAVRA